MCTLTFIPTSEGFYLTHNRDESISRIEAALPERTVLFGKPMVFPKDGQAGGTWIAATADLSVCILNGAFEMHTRIPPYRKSRGLVLLDIFQFSSPEEFSKHYNLNGIEPFTMVCWDSSRRELSEIRWDGHRVFYKPLKVAPALWSSATLYNHAAQVARQNIFQVFLLQNQNPSMNDIIHFHRTGEIGSKLNNLIMERASGVQTLSISQIQTDSSTCMWYQDLVHSMEVKLCL